MRAAGGFCESGCTVAILMSALVIAGALTDRSHAQSVPFYGWERVLDATIDGRYVSGAFSGGSGPSDATLADTDGDGDLDLYIGSKTHGLIFYRNSGTAQNPQWAIPEFDILNANADHHRPAFADIDGDDDLDLFMSSGMSSSTLDVVYYENTGTASSIELASGMPAYFNYTKAADVSFCDIDADGDLDAFLASTGTVSHFENTGTVLQAQWILRSEHYGGFNIYKDLDLDPSSPGSLTVDFADIDGDGDSDMWIGDIMGRMLLYHNNGDATNAVWPVLPTMGTNTLAYHGLTYPVFTHPSPALHDLDGDGDLDLLATTSRGAVTFHENVGTHLVDAWAPRVENMVSLDFDRSGALIDLFLTPTFADIDGDLDQDLFIGGFFGGVTFMENIGSPTAPYWANRGTNGFEEIDVLSTVYSSPFFADIDDDGDLDLFLGDIWYLYFYENTGTAQVAQWAPGIQGYNGIDWGGRFDAFLHLQPALADIDGDDDLDLFIGHQHGSMTFYENTGTASVAQWAPKVWPAPIPTDYSACKPNFIDIDHDGDLDFLRGGPQGNVFFSENIGSATNAVWSNPPITNFGDIFLYSSGASPSPYTNFTGFGDLDGDGHLDIMCGDDLGGLHYFRNPSSKLSISPPSLTLIAGQSNAFIAATQDAVVWTTIVNRSGGSIDTNGTYVAGTNAPAIDVIRGRRPNGQFGQAHVNVIRPEDASAAGKAIIIAGAKAADDPVWTATDFLADKAYRTLLHRGFSKDNIHYLSFDPAQDADGDGLTNDIDGASSLVNVTNAFEVFSTNASRLFVYLCDHGADSGGQGFVRLNPSENMSASQLASWLDSLQNDNTNLEVTVALDFCYSGSFLDELAWAGTAPRTVMASADTNELTYFIAGGFVSFSDAFFTGLQLGYDFGTAFQVARGAMSTYQQALIDDNGNGVYEKGIDGAVSTNRLGASFIAGQDVPQIGRVTPNVSVTNGTTVTLWIDSIASVYPLDRVWCAIVPPSHDPDPDSGIPVLDIPELELTYNLYQRRHEVTFNGFTEPGIYKVIFFVKDIWDSVSLPKQSYINQSGFEEKSIILAGGPKTDAAWSNIQFIASAAYGTFQARLFDDDTIYFLGADTNVDVDADGDDDVDALPSLSGLSNAISSWASSADRLTVYLIGEGSNNQLRVSDSEMLDAADLDAWLDAYQGASRDVTLILEFDGSGGFATNMAPPGGRERIILASTRQGRESIMEEGGLVSFSQYFLTEIFGGKTIGEASTRARKAIRRASGSVRQRAGIDDDGDAILNEKNVDGLVAQQRYIGAAFATGDDSPNIAHVMPITALTNSTQLTVWASDITDVDGIASVWCVITPPDYDGESELPRADLSYDAVDDRYEVIYTNFTQAGGYILTFYASDLVGEISPAKQGAVIRKDTYEDDNTFQAASTLNGDIFQLHTFHDDVDEDWVRFIALSNYVYDIETFHFTTNIDTVLDIYYRQPDGTLTNVYPTPEDQFGFDEGELTGLNFPQDGIYYAHISQFVTNGSGPGLYEVVIHVPAGNGLYFLGAMDELNGTPLPDGSYYLLNGVSNSLNGGFGLALTLPGGVHTVEVVPSDPDYLPSEHHTLQNQVQNPGSDGFGNPKTKDVPSGDMGEEKGSFVFSFMPYVTVSARVKDHSTKARMQGAQPSFRAQQGFFSATNGYVFDGYPFYASYKSNWTTDVEGGFPVSMRVPATNSDLTLVCAGYSNLIVSAALDGVAAGDVIDLGTLEMNPIDANGNGIADSWEAIHFSGTSVVLGVDTDGDGHTDDEEYMLGTDPNAATNALEAGEEMSTNGFRLVWPVENGRTYQIGCTTNLMSANWQVVAGPWEATAAQTEMSWTDTNSLTLTGRCYRVELLRP